MPTKPVRGKRVEHIDTYTDSKTGVLVKVYPSEEPAVSHICHPRGLPIYQHETGDTEDGSVLGYRAFTPPSE